VDTEIITANARESSTELFMKRAAERTTGSARGGSRAVVDKTDKLYEVCVEFEALFIKQMLSAMRKSVQKTGLLDGGMAQDIFEDMLYDEYAKSMAKTAGFGLADTVYLDLTSAQRAGLGSL
jgi:peptidoglycan hydrolase FlgJ